MRTKRFWPHNATDIADDDAQFELTGRGYKFTHPYTFNPGDSKKPQNPIRLFNEAWRKFREVQRCQEDREIKPQIYHKNHFALKTW